MSRSNRRGVSKDVQFAPKVGAQAAGLTNTESYNGMGGNRASVLAGCFGKYDSGHAVRGWLAASNASSSAS